MNNMLRSSLVLRLVLRINVQFSLQLLVQFSLYLLLQSSHKLNLPSNQLRGSGVAEVRTTAMTNYCH
jgi:hypothetical protein